MAKQQANARPSETTQAESISSAALSDAIAKGIGHLLDANAKSKIRIPIWFGIIWNPPIDRLGGKLEE